MSVSCISLALTIGVYSALPELRNLPGKNVVCLSASLLLAFACLSGEMRMNRNIRISSSNPEWPFCTLQITEILFPVDQSLPSEVYMVPRPFCLFLAVLTYFSFVSTFAWMTVMAFDICSTFRYRTP